MEEIHFTGANIYRGKLRFKVDKIYFSILEIQIDNSKNNHK